jgi:lipoprotein-releasing system permease protein
MKLPLLIGLRYTGAQRNSQLVSFFSGVSITGLVVGVGLLITVLSIMNGFDRELRQKILALVPQAAVYERGGTQDWWALQSRLEMRPRIQAAAPFIQLDGLVSHRGNAQPVVLYGVVPEEEARVSRLAEFLSDDVLRRLQDEPDQLVLGHSIAERLGVTEGEQLMVVVPGERAGTAPRITPAPNWITPWPSAISPAQRGLPQRRKKSPVCDCGWTICSPHGKWCGRP